MTMIPTNYSSYSRGSFWKTAFFTTVLALFNAFLFAQTTCDADAGSLNGEICIQNQEFTLKATLRGDTVVPDSFRILYVLTRGDSLIITQVSENPSFTIDELEGVYTIHTLVYDSTTLDLDSIELGETSGLDLFETFIAGGGTICAALDTAGVKFRFGNCDEDGCDADAGSLLAVAGACFQDSSATLTATIQDSAVVPDGYTLLYVLTSGDSLVVEQVSSDPTFTVDTVGTYRIHVLVYDSTTLDLDSIVIGETTGGDVNLLLLQGGGEICGALDVTGAVFNIEACEEDDCIVDAGTVSIDGGGSTITFCPGDEEDDILDLDNTGAELDSGTYVYLVTDTSNVVIRIITDASENFETIDSGSYRIYGFVYTADSLSVEEGDTLSFTTPIDSCSALSSNFITVTVNCDIVDPVCNVAVGRTTGTPIGCLDGDSITLNVTVQTPPTVPNGYSVIYVLTSGEDLVIEQASTDPSFDVDSAGTYRIHVLVYDSTTLDLGTIVFGETTGGDVNLLLTQSGGNICGALDVTGVRFDVINCPDSQDSCVVTFGSLIALNDSLCLDADSTSLTLQASVGVAPIVLDSYQLVYVLTSGDSLVIEAVNDEPIFTVDSIGTYRIHVLVYDSTSLDLDSIVLGTTTGFDVNELLIQGGGEICAALDTTGVLFEIAACVDSCGVSAGTLTAVSGACFQDSTATLTATIGDSAVVTDGYQVIYVLTSGDSLIIEQVNDEPTFTVDTIGTYRIHVLVYDSTTLNLDSIVIGETTGGDVNLLLIQGGGDICGALDVTGALFNIVACDSDSCDISAGTIQIADSTFCLDNTTGIATLTAEVVDSADAPDGYTLVYVLTSGDSLTIEAVDTIPSFEVETLGTYRIHPFVYDTTDFDLLDSLVVFGQTSALDLLPFSVGGGGDICADLDTVGAVFNVIACDPTGGPDSCNVTTGILAPAGISFCIDSTLGVVTLAGTIVNQPTAPAGYEILYLLSSGDSLVIEQTSTSPSFIVDTTGTYTIHILVYDPDSLEIDSVITFGETTGADLDSLLTQGGGDLCGGLDVAGLVFNVIDCNDFNDSCIVSAGALRILDDEFCLGDSTATLSAVIQTVPNVGPDYQIIYVLTSGDSLVVEEVSTTPTFTVDTTGDFRIHILVYDSTTLDLDSLVVFGTTTAANLDSLLLQGGGEICASLDTLGLLFSVEECTIDSSCTATAGSLSASGIPCLDDSDSTATATLTATVAQAPNVPAGYQVVYVLTSGTDLVIEQVNDTASFVIDTTGRYTIHTLVYDSTTLDLSTILFGVTTGGDVNGLLVQGGGEICAALDVAGVTFNVIPCDSTGVDSCEVVFETGKLMIIGNDVRCFEDASITTELRFTNSPTVPDGYAVAYVITENDSIITQVNTGLSLTVDSAAIYRIQVLIYDSTSLNLNTLIGTNTSDLNNLLIQGGGNTCGAFDTTGIVFVIKDCDDDDVAECDVDIATGSLSGDNNSDGNCLDGDNEVTLSASVVTEPTVPTGYQVIYVLTSGSDLVIEAVSDTPSFTVNQVGQFRIHVMVYNPSTLDLGDIDLGVTTAGQVNALLIQGGGNICAALDVTGVRFNTRDCSCGANAGELTYTRPGGRFVNLSQSGLAFLAGNTRMRSIVPQGYQRVYVLTSGDNLIIERIADIPVFGVRGTGTYRIHTLVYDPNTLDLSGVQLGVTSGLTINQLLRQGGGDICAALELPGLLFSVSGSNGLQSEGFTAFPNPATNQVNITLPEVNTVERVRIEMIDMNGNIAKQWQMDGYNANARLDITDIQPGMYYIRVLYDQEFVQEMNIVKVR